MDLGAVEDGRATVQVFMSLMRGSRLVHCVCARRFRHTIISDLMDGGTIVRFGNCWTTRSEIVRFCKIA